jgi:hypothetical protein
MKEEKIIAYRIKEGLFCPDCYEEAARKLRAAQDPNNAEIKIPVKPIMADDIRIFICQQCKKIGGPSAGEMEIQRKRGEHNPLIIVEHCARKIAFLKDFSNQIIVKESLNKNVIIGYYHVLADLEDDLKFALERLLKEGRA